MKLANLASILGFLVLGWVLMGFPGCAEAEELSPIDAFRSAQATGRLPAWAGATDSVSLRLDAVGRRVFLCLRDSSTGARWTSFGPLSSYQAFVRTGKYAFSPTVGTATYTDQRICWPDLQLPSRSLGEPAYLNVFRTVSGAVDWVRMNQPANIAGATTQGEVCSDPTSAGFYALPRLNTDGRTPLTRCE
ncbi:MAG: hypothetical protein Q8N51_00965 [Gammaproteobacteria bacterium]|nr:hypothetical protein [Gammaproteobacteria bacterium]